MKYFIQMNGRTIGPMSAQQMMAYGVTEQTMVCCDSGEWAPLFTFPELQTLLAAKRQAGAYNPGGKDKTVAGVLAILLGGLGAQYFYLGNVTGGLLSILLSMCTCGIWSVLMLVQGILMLTMSEDEFYNKYVNTDKTLPVF
ncbi:MAG: NINE protein [Muribaculaceae bacterium]|nr:NINE protein [Muribaculaceae bacterium]